jgi:hypothetical protein
MYVSTFFCFAFLCLITEGCGPTIHRRLLVIPKGYRGWLAIQYDVKQAPPLIYENGQIVLVFPKSGVLKTSSPVDHEYIVDRYVYRDAKGTYPLRWQGMDENGKEVSTEGVMVWGGSVKEEGMGNDTIAVYEARFVGTKQEYEKAQRAGGPSVPGLERHQSPP